jgi:nucleoside phosphorylase
MPDLAKLLYAVKSSARTDQYVVLCAMFVTGAYETPVTAAEVAKALKLHLRRKTPKNIPDCLRKARPLVTPVEDGRPLKWKLTDEGLQKIHALSGLPLEVKQTDSYAYDIAIICALEFPELAAVIDAFGGSARWKIVGDSSHTHVYRETEITTANGAALRVIATAATSMGLTAAAIATTQLIMQFRPRLVAMIGIAAGTRSGNKQFGDILVADPSVDYASGKLVVEDGVRRLQPDPYPLGLNARLRSVLQRYRNAPSLFDSIRKRWNGSVPSRPNRMHLGPVGAADQVIDDASRVLEIQLNWRKLIGVEMETYGVYRAVHESPEPKPRAVSFKAVCDFAAEKNDDWQEYAAFFAAEFAAEFVKLEWESLWPSRESN